MKYWHKVWPYFLLITCGANVIIIIYNGQIFTRIATLVLYVIIMLGAVGAILTRYSKWAQLRVRNASIAQYQKAHDYGNARVGAPYNWQFREKADGFYCSELVAFAWRFGANLDIIPQKKDWNMIWPMDLYNSSATYVHRGGIV